MGFSLKALLWLLYNIYYDRHSAVLVVFKAVNWKDLKLSNFMFSHDRPAMLRNVCKRCTYDEHVSWIFVTSRPIFEPFWTRLLWWRQILKLIDFGLSKFYAHPEVIWLQQSFECTEGIGKRDPFQINCNVAKGRDSLVSGSQNQADVLQIHGADSVGAKAHGQSCVLVLKDANLLRNLGICCAGSKELRQASR